MILDNKLIEKEDYNKIYSNYISTLDSCDSSYDVIEYFEKIELRPFCNGGIFKGYVRNLSVNKLLDATSTAGVKPEELTILDAACGAGELSIYLACKGFNIVGVDFSAESCHLAEYMSKKIGVSDKCIFLAESLENMSIADSSIDFIIGHDALHHFIKYENVPKEFQRVMKDRAKGFFADGFGENLIYHIFHDKELMERLGDEILTKKVINNFFNEFQIHLTPTDWFVMLDRLYHRLLRKKWMDSFRHLSKIHFWLDRRIPDSNRISLFLSGSIMTTITKRSQ